MTDDRTREQKISDLLDLSVKLETAEDREMFEMFNALPDEVKISLLFVHNPGFRNRVIDIVWGEDAARQERQQGENVEETLSPADQAWFDDYEQERQRLASRENDGEGTCKTNIFKGGC